MRKYMKVTLVVEVEDLSLQQRKDCARDAECKVADLVTVKDISAPDFAEILIGTPSDDYDPRFEGTDKYAQFGGYYIESATFMSEPNRHLSKVARRQIKASRSLMRPAC